MPLFQYTATDSTGQRVEGMLQGETWRDVDTLLQQRGLNLTGIAEVPAPRRSAPAPVRPRVVSYPDPPTVAAPSALAHSSPPTAIQRTTVHIPWWKSGSDSSRSFLFSQIAAFTKAGVNPADALDKLAKNWSNSVYSPVLAEASAAATNGKAVADVFGRYPKLFPDYVVAIYRAGELGGFVPEACTVIAEQAQDSHRLKRSYFWLFLFWWSVVLSLPLAFLMGRGLLRGWDVIDAGGGQGNAFAQLGGAFGHEARQLALPVLLILGGGMILGRVMRLRRFDRLRHQLVLVVPTTGRRARHEAARVFAWTLGQLFRAALPPKTAFEMAAQSVPNVALAEELRHAASRMSFETPISAALGDVNLLPQESKIMIQTGEFVGDLPGAMAHVAEIEREEFRSMDASAKRRIAIQIGLLMLLGSCITYAVMQRIWITGLLDRMDMVTP